MLNKIGGIKKEIFTNLGQHTAKLLITFLFTVGIIGGSTYLLIQADADWDQINSALSSLDKINYITELKVEMIQDSTKNGKSSRIFIENVMDLMDSLIKKDINMALDSKFKNYSLRVCADALYKLNDAKGSVRGFVFESELDKSYQEEMIRLYSKAIEIAAVMEKITQNWNNLKSFDKRKRLNELLPKILETKQILRAISTKSLQMEKEHHLQKTEARIQIQKVKNQIKAFTLKKILSIVGIFSGTFVIILIFVLFIKASDSSPKVIVNNAKNVRMKRK